MQLDDVCSERSRPTRKYSNEKRSTRSQTASQAHDLEQQEHLHEASIPRNKNHQRSKTIEKDTKDHRITGHCSLILFLRLALSSKNKTPFLAPRRIC